MRRLLFGSVIGVMMVLAYGAPASGAAMRCRRTQSADDSNYDMLINALEDEPPMSGDNLTLYVENPEGHRCAGR